MDTMKNTSKFFGACLLLLSFILFWPTSVKADFYKYVDKNGTVHFTDRYESIPKEYRNQIRTIQERPSPQAPAQPLEEKEKKKDEGSVKEKTSQSKAAEEKKKEAEARAAREKEEQERKLQARQEKEKQIDDLRKQIEAKEQEIKSLRTTWMVYDRANLYRLNQEIDALKKEVRSIQDELIEEQ
jgi:flagellar biosynthesis GTPase FlhF